MQFFHLRLTLIFIAVELASPVRLGAGNLVQDGSFELGFQSPAWHFSGVDLRGYRDQAAEGTNFIIGGVAYQDVPTVPGESYFIQFATKGSMPTVYFGGVLLSTTPTTVPIFASWNYRGGFGLATGTVTRLEFNNGWLDDVQVVSIYDPLEITRQPESRSVIEGGTVAFTVRVAGPPPINYTWHHNNVPVPGGTNATLELVNVSQAQAGTYSVSVSNALNFLVSSNATLVVDLLPEAPQIFSQPAAELVPSGYAYTLGVVALGNAPLRYQWSLNGVVLPGATNSVLYFPELNATNAGIYSVLVENDLGSVQSLPATLRVTNATGNGYVDHSNIKPGFRRPIYDVDGLTPLSGTNFYAQLYAGPTPNLLRPVGARRPFLTSGYFNGGLITIPDVAAGETAYVQTRCWAASAGVSYEDARARGGKFGAGRVFSVATVIPPAIPSVVPQESFSLKAGLPLFTTGKLQVNDPRERPLVWKLTGAAGSAYLIERREPPMDWLPLLVLTNVTGTAYFTDTNAQNHSVNFYRARILD